MKKLIIFAAIFLTSASALAQYPYMPDTVIVDTVYVDFGQPYADVPIFAVTDEWVMFYNFPITWSSDSEGIEPSDVFYYYMLEHWDETFDSVLVDEHFIRMVGWIDPLGPFDLFLNTDSLRLRCWSIRFTIDSLASPQIVIIDTTYDPINGPLLFGLEDGVTAFTPVLNPGAIFYGITSENCENGRNLPGKFALVQNYPNPFNASTTIEFALPEAADVELSVYNILGQKVATLYDGQKLAGKHSITWKTEKEPSGLYFARLETSEGYEHIKMVLIK